MFEKVNAAKDAKDATLNEGAHVVHDVREAVGHLRSDINDAAGTVKSDLEDVARQTGKQARAFTDSAGHSLSDLGATMKTKIRDNPIQSSLIALGVGLTLGMLCRR